MHKTATPNDYFFTQLTKDEYAEFQKKHELTDFMNSVQAVELNKKRRWSVDYVGIKNRDGDILAATNLCGRPIMKKFVFFYCQRGPLLDYRDSDLLNFFLTGLRTYAKQRHGLFLLFDPVVPFRDYDIDGKPVEGGKDNRDLIEKLEDLGLGIEYQGEDKDFSHLAQARWTFSLWMNGKNADQIFNEMQLKTRRSIKKTMKYGIEVRELKSEESKIFVDMLHATGERRKFNTKSQESFRQLQAAFGDMGKTMLAYLDVDKYLKSLHDERKQLDADLAKLEERKQKDPDNKKLPNRFKLAHQAIEVNDKNLEEAKIMQQKYGKIVPMASGYYVETPESLVYLYGASYTEFSHYDAPYAMHWKMINYAIDKGIPRYNFYGISGNFSADAVDYGVYLFKKGFGGIVEKNIGDFVLPINRPAYKFYRSVKSLRHASWCPVYDPIKK